MSSHCMLSVELVLQAKSLETLKQLLLNGANINYQSQRGWCLLLELVVLNQPKSIKALSLYGFKLQIRDVKGRNALFWAIHSGHIKVIEALLELGFDVGAEVGPGIGALEYAKYKKNQQIIALLDDICVPV